MNYMTFMLLLHPVDDTCSSARTQLSTPGVFMIAVLSRWQSAGLRFPRRGGLIVPHETSMNIAPGCLYEQI